MKGFLEALGKGGRRVLIDWNEIIAISTASGCDTTTIAGPDSPLSVLMRNNDELEVFGLSADSIMIAMKMHGRIEGWLPLP